MGISFRGFLQQEKFIFTESATGLIQSIRRDVCFCLFVCLSPPLVTGIKGAGNFWSKLHRGSGVRSHVTGDKWLFFRAFLYRCYYPHTSRDSVSRICGIFALHLPFYRNKYFLFSVPLRNKKIIPLTLNVVTLMFKEANIIYFLKTHALAIYLVNNPLSEFDLIQIP